MRKCRRMSALAFWRRCIQRSAIGRIGILWLLITMIDQSERNSEKQASIYGRSCVVHYGFRFYENLAL